MEKTDFYYKNNLGFQNNLDWTKKFKSTSLPNRQRNTVLIANNFSLKCLLEQNSKISIKEEKKCF